MTDNNYNTNDDDEFLLPEEPSANNTQNNNKNNRNDPSSSALSGDDNDEQELLIPSDENQQTNDEDENEILDYIQDDDDDEDENNENEGDEAVDNTEDVEAANQDVPPDEDNGGDDDSSSSSSSSSLSSSSRTETYDDDNDDDEDETLLRTDEMKNDEQDNQEETASNNKKSVLSFLTPFRIYPLENMSLVEVSMANTKKFSSRNLADVIREHETYVEVTTNDKNGNNDPGINKPSSTTSFADHHSFAACVFGEVVSNTNMSTDGLVRKTISEKKELILIASFSEAYLHYGSFSQLNNRPSFFGTHPSLRERFENNNNNRNYHGPSISQFQNQLVKSLDHSCICSDTSAAAFYKNLKSEFNQMVLLIKNGNSEGEGVIISNNRKNNKNNDDSTNNDNSDIYEIDSAADEWEDLRPYGFTAENFMDEQNMLLLNEGDLESLMGSSRQPSEATSLTGFHYKKRGNNNKTKKRNKNRNRSNLEVMSSMSDDDDDDFSDDDDSLSRLEVVSDDEDDENADLQQLSELMLQRDSYSGSRRRNNNNFSSKTPRAVSTATSTALLFDASNRGMSMTDSMRRERVREQIRQIKQARRLAKKKKIGLEEASLEGPFVNSASLLVHPAPIDREYISFPVRVHPLSTRRNLVETLECEVEGLTAGTGLNFAKTFPGLFSQIDEKKIREKRVDEKKPVVAVQNMNNNITTSSYTNNSNSTNKKQTTVKNETKKNNDNKKADYDDEDEFLLIDDIPLAQLAGITKSLTSNIAANKKTNQQQNFDNDDDDDILLAQMFATSSSNNNTNNTAPPPPSASSAPPFTVSLTDEAQRIFNTLRETKEFLPQEKVLIKKDPMTGTWVWERRILTTFRRIFAVDQAFRQKLSKLENHPIIVTPNSAYTGKAQQPPSPTSSLQRLISLLPQQVTGTDFLVRPRNKCHYRERLIAEELIKQYYSLPENTNNNTASNTNKIPSKLIGKLGDEIVKNYKFCPADENDNNNNNNMFVNNDSSHQQRSSATSREDYWQSISPDAQNAEAYVKAELEKMLLTAPNKLKKLTSSSKKNKSSSTVSVSGSSSNTTTAASSQATIHLSQLSESRGGGGDDGVKTNPLPSPKTASQQTVKSSSQQKTNPLPSPTIVATTSTTKVAAITNQQPQPQAAAQVQNQNQNQQQQAQQIRIKDMSCSEITSFLEASKKVPTCILNAFRSEEWAGFHFAMEEFIEDAFDEDLCKKYEISKFNVKAFGKFRSSVL